MLQNKLETYFPSLILYMWILVFSCLQHHACFVVIAFVLFFIVFLKDQCKELTQDRGSSTQVFFKKHVAVH